MKSILTVTLTLMIAMSGAASAAVVIGGKNEQRANIGGSATNTANGKKATAVQNVSSNMGAVTIKGSNTQVSNIQGGVTNTAKGAEATAVQNIASNQGDK